MTISGSRRSTRRVPFAFVRVGEMRILQQRRTGKTRVVGGGDGGRVLHPEQKPHGMEAEDFLQADIEVALDGREGCGTVRRGGLEDDFDVLGIRQDGDEFALDVDVGESRR